MRKDRKKELMELVEKRRDAELQGGVIASMPELIWRRIKPQAAELKRLLPDASQKEISELAEELSELTCSYEPVARETTQSCQPEDQGNDVEWGAAKSTSDWAKQFDYTPTHFRRLVKEGKIRIKKTSTARIHVHPKDVETYSSVRSAANRAQNG